MSENLRWPEHVGATIDDWLVDLKPFERELAQQLLLKYEGDGLAASIDWLSASGPSDTAGMGAFTLNVLPRAETFKREIVKLVCGRDPDYAAERNRLSTQFGVTTTGFAAAVAGVIGPAVSLSPLVLVGPIALVLATVGNVGRNAWCADHRLPDGDGPPLLDELN
jgi:hypothetical protein